MKEKSLHDMVLEQIKQQAKQVKYCLFCGKPVMMSSSNEDGSTNRNMEWEMKSSAHYSCYVNDLEKKRRK